MTRYTSFYCLSTLIVALSGNAIVSGQRQPAKTNSSAQALVNSSQQITPTAPRGARFEPLNPDLSDFPEYNAGQAVTTVTSPDHKTLLILTSGYNLLNATSGTTLGNQINADSTEYVFVYNIAGGAPVKTHVIQVPNTYQGIVFDPSGHTFYVSGSVDDNVHIYDLNADGWSERLGSPIALGHQAKACAALLVDRFSHFVTILRRRSVYFQEKGLAVLA